MEAIQTEQQVTQDTEAAPGTVTLLRPYVDEENPEVAEGRSWRIEDLETLDWALKRMAELERQAEENMDVCRRRIEELQQRTLQLNEKLDKGIRFFRSHVEGYAREHRAELLGSGRKKSRALLHGTVGWRQRAASLEVQDKEALLAWARQQDVELELVRFKEEPAIDAVKKHFKATGEVPPGTEVRPEAEELFVKLESDKGVL